MADENTAERTAIVTGGARGIGAAIAGALAGAGYRVAILDNGCSIDGRDPDPTVVDSAASALGDGVRGWSVDVSDAAAVRDAVEAVTQWGGGVDVLVNNAAVLRDGFIFKARPEDFAKVLSVNLTGAFLMTNAVTPVMRDRAKAADGGFQGRIVNIVSTAGLYGNFGQSAYASAKAGLVGLTRVTAMDMARAGVTCNAVAPFAATRVTETIRPQNDEQALYKEHAMSVPAGPVAALVTDLCGDAAASVTGQLFGVRGREVFLFSQPRPVATALLGTDDVLAALAPTFVPLETDLESFSGAPIL